MESVILCPSQALWRPRRVVRATVAGLFEEPLAVRLPHYLDGDRASGATLLTCLPAANQPPATNYAALVLRNGRWVLAFDTTTQQAAIFVGKIPRNYSPSPTGLTVYLTWAAASATSGTIGWDVTFERNTDGGDDLDADSWATAQVVTAATVPGTAGIPKVTSVACAHGATGTDSLAAGDDFRIRIRRDVATDTAAGDAHVLSVELKET